MGKIKQVILLTLAGLAIVLGGLYVTIPPPYPGIFDADLNRLAESYEDAWCSGFVFWTVRSGGDAKLVKKCQEENNFSTEIDHDIVQIAFCVGVKAGGWDGNVYTDCMPYLTNARLWPTMKGTLSRAFNDNYPYPGDTFAPAKTDGGDNSRTGEREGFFR